jgi:hypothetical protein
MVSGSVTFDDADAMEIILEDGPDGYKRVFGIPGFPGVYKYKGAQYGRPEPIVNILLLPEVLNDEAQLSTIKNVAVTHYHPDDPEGITESNIKKYSAGHVSADYTFIEFAGETVPKVELLISSDKLKADIKSGKLRELSPGVRRKVRWESGVHPKYGAYQGIFEERTYNHLAAVKKARGGRNCTILNDGEEGMTEDELKAVVNTAMIPIFARLDALTEVVRAGSKVTNDEEAVVFDEADFIKYADRRSSLISAADRHGVKHSGVSNSDIAKAILPKLNISFDCEDAEVAVLAYERAFEQITISTGENPPEPGKNKPPGKTIPNGFISRKRK